MTVRALRAHAMMSAASAETLSSFLILKYRISFSYLSFIVFWESPYFFRKNLTRRKFTGMQMQRVGIIASCLARPKPTKRLRQRVCIE